MGRGESSALLLGRSARERSHDPESPEERERERKVKRYLSQIQNNFTLSEELIHELPDMRAFAESGSKSSDLIRFSDRVCDDFGNQGSGITYMIRHHLSEEQGERVMKHALDNVIDSQKIHFYHFPHTNEYGVSVGITIAIS